MSSGIPEWVNAEIFESVLKKNVENYEKILNFSAKPAFSAGENFLSILLTVEIEVVLKDGAKKSLSYMLKIPPTSEQAMMIINLLRFFTKETITYNKLLPAFEKLYKDAGKNIKFGPDSYTFEKDVGVETVLLEDLRVKGFKNKNRLVGLDMEHTHCALRKIAEFHAVTAVYFEKIGPFSDVHMTPSWSEQVIAMMKVSQKPQNIKFVESLPLYKAEHLKEKILKYQEVYQDQLVITEHVDENEFFVLSHGDCWINNFMFQHDEEGHVKDTLFVDFQVSKYVSFANDLVYFILSSVSYENKLKHFDDFVQYYHQHLSENLKVLNYSKKIPTLKQLHMSIIKYNCFAYTTILKTLPVVLLDPNAKADISFDNMMGEKSVGNPMQHIMYTNSNYAKHIEAILPWMENRGCFDTE